MPPGSNRHRTTWLATSKNNAKLGRPDLNIGDRSVIERAILDKDCRIGRGVRLVNESGQEKVYYGISFSPGR